VARPLRDIVYNQDIDLEHDLKLMLVRDILAGMAFLHGHNMVHGTQCLRDPQSLPLSRGNAGPGRLRISNLLVDDHLHVKVSDFGFACYRTNSPSPEPQNAHNAVYLAPEVLLDLCHRSKAADVCRFTEVMRRRGRQPAGWPSRHVCFGPHRADAFGIVVSEIFQRKAPYDGEDLEDVLVRVKDITLWPLFRPSGGSAAVTGGFLMHESWAIAAADRPSFENLLKRVDALNVRSVGVNLFHQDEEKQRQARVLQRCFPLHIAEALKEGRAIVPERKEMVTLLFCEIVNYADISSTLAPEELSDLLERLCKPAGPAVVDACAVCLSVG
jgi:serine/threonine protein kinase